MTQALAPHFKQIKQGKIVNIASTSGRLGGGGTAAYSASKAAVINLTQSLALSLAPFDINVNAICPGLVWTPLWEDIEAKLSNTSDRIDIGQRTRFNELASQSPLKRSVSPEDIGHAAVFLASSQSRNITGQALNIDAGVQMN